MSQQQPSGPLGADAAVTHILVVSDPARSRDFWIGVLGAELFRRVRRDEHSAELRRYLAPAGDDRGPRGLRSLPRQHPPREANRVNHGIVAGEPGELKGSRRVVCPANDYVEKLLDGRGSACSAVISVGDAFNIIVAVLSRLRGFVFCDPTGGSDGQEGVVPGGVGAVGAVCGGVRVVADVSVVFAFGGGRPGCVSSISSVAGLSARGLASGELTEEQAERFIAARRAAGRVTWVAPQSVTLPLGYLHELGVVPMPAPAVAQGALEELLEDYRRYLLIERRLSEHTVVDAYVPAARLFLVGREGPDGLGLERLCAADVSSFLARECPKRSVSGARDLVCALRSLLRFLHLAGLIDAPLVWAVPSIADLRDRTLPRGLEPGAVKKLLASCDRRTAGRPARLRGLCCCCRGWGCAPGRSPRSGWMMSTGAADCCSFRARVAARTSCRCRLMSARRSWPISVVVRGASAGCCSCG